MRIQKCKNRPRPPSLPPQPPSPPPSIIIEKVVVNTHENVIQKKPKTLEEQYHEHKLMENDLRKQRIKSLMANAFFNFSCLYINV